MQTDLGSGTLFNQGFWAHFGQYMYILQYSFVLLSSKWKLCEQSSQHCISCEIAILHRSLHFGHLLLFPDPVYCPLMQNTLD